MACRICKRGACTESFHSIEEQERFEKVEELAQKDSLILAKELIEAQQEIKDLKNVISNMEDTISDLEFRVNHSNNN